MQFRQQFTAASPTAPSITSAGAYDVLVPIPAGGLGSYRYGPTDPPAGAALMLTNLGGTPVIGVWWLSELPLPAASAFPSKAAFTINANATVTALIPATGQDTLLFGAYGGTGQVGVLTGTMSLIYDCGPVELTPGAPGSVA